MTAVWDLILVFHVGIIFRSCLRLRNYGSTLVLSALGETFLQFRWYQNPDIDTTTIPSITLENARHQDQRDELDFVTNESSQPQISNPLESPTRQPRPTDTISARTVFHETQAALRGLTTHIQTQEQMDDLLERLNHLEYVLILYIVNQCHSCIN